MGGVSRPDPWGVGRGVGAVGAVGSPAEVPPAPPRPEEAQAQATERGSGQACRHREDSKSSSYVHKLTHPRGWVRTPASARRVGWVPTDTDADPRLTNIHASPRRAVPLTAGVLAGPGRTAASDGRTMRTVIF